MASAISGHHDFSVYAGKCVGFDVSQHEQIQKLAQSILYNSSGRRVTSSIMPTER